MLQATEFLAITILKHLLIFYLEVEIEPGDQWEALWEYLEGMLMWELLV